MVPPLMADLETEFHKRWLSMVEPIDGLVVSVPVLADAQTMHRHGPELSDLLLSASDDGEPALTEPIAPDDEGRPRRRIRDLDGFLRRILGLEPAFFDRGDALPEDLSLYVREGDETLRPTLALRKRGPAATAAATSATAPRDGVPDDSTLASRAGAPYVMLVWDLPGVSLDRADTREGAWAYPPAAKFDRLLRACRVPIGLLTDRAELRLVYAPHGESSGAITFKIGDLASVGGREILDGLVLLLSARRFFGVAVERQLPALLVESRARQANVTNTLADQVFEALGVLLRGFEAAAERDGEALLDDALATGGERLYGGLLTVLLRLVFLLYAEDRGLLPTKQPLYADHLGVLSLFAQLQTDFAAYPDTMARRFGAWPRLLAVFRAVYFGARHGEVVIPARRGQLFDPHAYPFLEGWGPAGSAPVDAEDRAAVRVPTVDDGTVFEVLHKLLVLDGQRLSYRVLDVEQIGSVYEALMGYRILRAQGAAVCLKPYRMWVGAAEVLAEAGSRRAAFVEDLTGLPKAAALKLGAGLAGARTEGEVLAGLEGQRVGKVAAAKSGQLLIQPGAERRRTSSHYTPRSLSEPIVRKTLEPLLLAMGREPSSEQLLSLKVCDPAMGSGAFLVEACRFLGDQVVAAWTREGVAGEIAAGAGVDDLVNHARRMVAQRCLYGVDKNPYAVNLAKLSLWLVTLARDEPFTFVDHALRYGDSLVGLSLDQIKGFHWKPEKQLDFVFKEIAGALDEAVGLRQRILDMAGQSGADTKEKERLLWDAEDALDRVRLIGDLVVGAFFAHEKDKDREKERVRRLDLVRAWLKDGAEAPQELRDMQAEQRERNPAFHWMVEFPEVFWAGRKDPLEGGKVNEAAFMDAFVGNPPFAGKNAISLASGAAYIFWLQAIQSDSNGAADLCAHFFRVASRLLGAHGTMGLIATNTIAEGDTRETGLKPLLAEGCVIYEAQRSMPWPGAASVSVAVVHLAKGNIAAAMTRSRLDGLAVAYINSRLRAGSERTDAVALAVNERVRFRGCKVYGEGFVLTPGERGALVAHDGRNAERTFAYIGGEEINSSASLSFERFVINFAQLTLDAAEGWPDLMAIVRAKVKPERDLARDNADGMHRKKYWWQFAQPRPELFEATAASERCLVNSEVSKHLIFAFQPTERVFSHTLHVYALPAWSSFAVLQSRAHEPWARLLSSSMRTDLRYSATDCFDTFPFPQRDPRTTIPALEAIGAHLYTTRAAYMLAHQVGLTTTYNRLKDPDNHDPEIVQLRRLHEDMDRAVLAAYGWTDLLVPPYGTPTTDAAKKALERFEDEVIDKLFALNAERAEEEKLTGAGATKGAKGAKAKPSAPRAKRGAKQEPAAQLGLLVTNAASGPPPKPGDE